MLRSILTLAALLAASWLTACGGGDAATASPPAAPAPPASPAPGDLPSASQLLSYAELAYQDFFPTHEVDRTLAPYTYRYYPGTRNAVGIANGLIYALGPVVRNNTTPVQVASVADFACDRVPGACGDRIDHVIRVGDVDRSFVVWRSNKAHQAGNAPVVFMLHGTSGTADEFLRRSGWREKADREGLIAVFPQALVHCYMQDEDFDGVPDRNVWTKWAAGKLGDPAVRPLCNEDQLNALTPDKKALADHPLADDIAYFRDMVAFVKANYSVDAKRIYVSGFSNGAEMSGRLAAEMSDLFAAIHCASSVMSTEIVAARGISVVHSMGNLDPSQGRRAGYYDAATQTLAPMPLDESLIQNPAYASGFVKPFLDMLQMAQTYTWSQVTVSERITSRFEFATSAVGRNNVFRAIVIEGLEHEYPNGENHRIVMADEIWEFFKVHRLP